MRKSGLALMANHVVQDVVPGSRADQAGVRPYDVLIEIGGREITPAHVLDDMVRENETILTVIRRGEIVELTVPAIEQEENDE